MKIRQSIDLESDPEPWAIIVDGSNDVCDVL